MRYFFWRVYIHAACYLTIRICVFVSDVLTYSNVNKMMSYRHVWQGHSTVFRLSYRHQYFTSQIILPLAKPYLTNPFIDYGDTNEPRRAKGPLV